MGPNCKHMAGRRRQDGVLHAMDSLRSACSEAPYLECGVLHSGAAILDDNRLARKLLHVRQRLRQDGHAVELAQSRSGGLSVEVGAARQPRSAGAMAAGAAGAPGCAAEDVPVPDCCAVHQTAVPPA
jgi:hypothetical protein